MSTGGSGDRGGLGGGTPTPFFGQVELERDLLEARARLERVLEGSSDGFWEWHVPSGELFVSPRFREILGAEDPLALRQADEVVRRVHPDDLAKTWSTIEGALEGSKQQDHYELAHRFRRDDGEIVWVEVKGSITERDANGGAVRVSGVVADVTRRMVAETRTKEVEARHHALFESVDAAILLMRGPICIDCNPATPKLFGVASVEEFIGKEVLDFAVPIQPNGESAADLVGRNIERALSHGTQLFEWQARRADGQLFQMEVRFTPIELAGEPLFQCIAVDITDRKRAEEALRESRQELATYHDLVTHDFANFSTTVLGILDELLAEGADLSSPDALLFLRSARRQAFEMSRLAENARLLSRLRERRLELAEPAAPLDRIVASAVETIRAVHFDRELDLRIELPADRPLLRVPMLDNVVLNLLDNAVRHSGRKDAVRIALLADRPADDLGQLRIRIVGGRPPDPETLSRLFQRWQPGPQSTGSGLGLSLAQEIVVRCGGRLEVGVGQIEGEPLFRVTLALPCSGVGSEAGQRPEPASEEHRIEG
jgi:PAS domain S-box-containing protein